MRVWRLCKSKYAANAFSGEGARLYGGRWNYPGYPVVYTAESRSLAILEHRVHTAEIVPQLVLIPADLPDTTPVTRISLKLLPVDWNTYPAPEELRQMGTDWITSAETAVLVVPSAVIPGDQNVLLNPSHPDFDTLRIGQPETFTYDRRLF